MAKEEETMKIGVARVKKDVLLQGKSPEEALCDFIIDTLITATIYLENAKQMLGVFRERVRDGKDSK